ncbi:Protein dopey [Ceratocystis platani]|uniref:Protein dopey n=1 Tax=Ceratocystis fimbriata f. sp. platani TaxID=88771 RepID=A0A0F8BRB3_CERFI|nr:Protein dopey [Ceratocystis platani]
MATLEPGSAAHSPTPDSSGRASPIPRQWRNQLSSGDHPSKADKAFRRYAVVVDKALALFETSLDEWADYISFLNRLLKALQARTANMNAVPSRTMVAKRLAQCLNPQLPSGVHQKALEVYGYIFDMIGPEGLSRDLPLYLPGLATTLSFASLSTITDDKKLRTDDERLGDIRLAAFILANFNVREEEMITLHAPMLAASILCRAKAIKYGRFNTSIGWTVVKEALGVVLTLLELAPARAFVSIEDEKAVKVADSDAIVSKAIGDWYEEHHGNIEETEPPYSAAKIETILFNQACAAFSASLQSPQHATIVVQSYDILAQLLSKVPMNQHTIAPLHDVISAIRMGLLKYPTIPFPTFAAMLATATQIFTPLMLMLDALLDERTQLYMTVKMWLNTTIGLDRLLFVFILKFSELPFLSKNGPVLTDFGFQDPAISEEDDVDMCLYLIRTLSNVLDVAPDLLWSLMASNNVSDQHFYNRISKITGKEEVAMQEFFVHVCMHCIARNYVPKDSNLKERESQLCRSALALLTQLLGSSYADSLAQLNLQDALISRLHQSLSGPEPYVQVLLLEVVLVSLKLSVKADPPAPETIPEDKCVDDIASYFGTFSQDPRRSYEAYSPACSA